ncbi:MAG TPA: hypothetical protein DF613_01480 [Lachnospiraceae bacterium]|nr:hypothetical protein [Lachnospiraceae bacterium]
MLNFFKNSTNKDHGVNKDPGWIFLFGNTRPGFFYPCFNGLLIQSGNRYTYTTVATESQSLF